MIKINFRAKLKQYVRNCFIAWDQGANAWLFFGSPEETISSRVGRNAAGRGGFWLTLQKFINWLMENPNHCAESILTNVPDDAVVKD